MTNDEIHARIIALFNERTPLQRRIRSDTQRLAEIEAEIRELDAQRVPDAGEKAT